VQASLAAAFLRLDRSVAQGTDDDELLASLQAEVLQMVSEFNIDDTEPDPIDKVIALTQSNWSGAVHVNVIIDPLARASLASDPLTARSVNDLIPELVFNSVRHGSARGIDVQLEIADFRTLALTVIDGRGVMAKVASVLASAEADIVHIEMGEANSHDAKDMHFVIAVRDRAHLENILTKLQRSAVVMHAKRSKKTG
jgi:hypothetical protein